MHKSIVVTYKIIEFIITAISYTIIIFSLVIVKASNGPRYVVGCRKQINRSLLKQGTRVALDMTTLTIMR